MVEIALNAWVLATFVSVGIMLLLPLILMAGVCVYGAYKIVKAIWEGDW